MTDSKSIATSTKQNQYRLRPFSSSQNNDQAVILSGQNNSVSYTLKEKKLSSSGSPQGCLSLKVPVLAWHCVTDAFNKSGFFGKIGLLVGVAVLGLPVTFFGFLGLAVWDLLPGRSKTYEKFLAQVSDLVDPSGFCENIEEVWEELSENDDSSPITDKKSEQFPIDHNNDTETKKLHELKTPSQKNSNFDNSNINTFYSETEVLNKQELENKESITNENAKESLSTINNNLPQTIITTGVEDVNERSSKFRFLEEDQGNENNLILSFKNLLAKRENYSKFNDLVVDYEYYDEEKFSLEVSNEIKEFIKKGKTVTLVGKDVKFEDGEVYDKLPSEDDGDHTGIAPPKIGLPKGDLFQKIESLVEEACEHIDFDWGNG